MTTKIQFMPTSWQENQHALMKIRESVFMQEQQVSAADEYDGADENAFHFLACAPAKTLGKQPQPIGCARLLSDGHIGRVALLKPFRQQGTGQALVAFIIQWTRNHQPHIFEQGLFLYAQTNAIGFYEKLGFLTAGNVFMDAGIAHQLMNYYQA